MHTLCEDDYMQCKPEFVKPICCALLNKFNFWQIVGGSEHTLRAKLTFSQETHGMHLTFSMSCPLSDLPVILHFCDTCVSGIQEISQRKPDQ